MQLALGHHRDQHVERLFGDPVDLLDVEQGAVAQRGDERAVDERVGPVAVGQHLRRVEGADEARRRELGVALDEHELRTGGVGQRAQHRRLAGAGRTLEQHVAIGGERGDEQLELAPPTDHLGIEAVDEGPVDLHVQRSVGQRVRDPGRDQYRMTPRMFLPSRMSW